MKGVLPPTIGKSASELGGHRNGHEFKEGISKNQNLRQTSNSCVHPSVRIF